MRALAISDTHFGAWTGDDLLSHPFALERLEPLLEDIDELVLLGDLFDFLFAREEDAFAAADPFFTLVRDKLQGKRVVFLAGNHDHHIMLREARRLFELHIATGRPLEELADVPRRENYFGEFLRRRLDGVETAIEYPTYRVGDALLFHGHYLDAHMENSFANRLLTKGIWAVAGGRPDQALTMADYESVIVPLTELLYSVAQLPRGTSAQQATYEALNRAGRILGLPALPAREARRLWAWLSRQAYNIRHFRELGAVAELDPGQVLRRGSGAAVLRPEEGDVLDAMAGPDGVFSRDRGRGQELSIARVVGPDEPVGHAVEAYDLVVHNLGWDQETDIMVFAHTHQPLAGVRAREGGRMRYWNTGCWIYEPSLGSSDSYVSYLRNGWPGTAVLIDTDEREPRLIEAMRDLNPLVQATGDRAPGSRAAARATGERLLAQAERAGEEHPELADVAAQPVDAAVDSMVQRRRARKVAVAAVGITAVIDILGGLFPKAAEEVRSVAVFLPVGQAQGARALLVLVGVLLLLLTRGLWRGNRRAWLGALVLAAGSVVLHLVRHGNVTEAIVSLLLVLVLLATASAFRVRAREVSRPLAIALAAAVAGVFVYGLVGWEAVHRGLPERNLVERAGVVARNAVTLDPGIEPTSRSARLFLDSLDVLAAAFWIFVVVALLGAVAAARLVRRDPDELAAFLTRNGRTSVAPLVGLPGNEVLELCDGRALAGLKVVNHVAVTVGEPVAEPGLERQALEEFVARCEHSGWTPALLAVSEETAEHARTLGFDALKVSEDAIVRLADFTLQGKPYAKLRAGINRARREGVEVHRYDEARRSDEGDARLREISEAWLQTKGGGELGFTLGRFDPDLLSRQEVYVAEHDGRIVAFCTWLPYLDGRAAVVDLMRRSPDAPPGTMELLFTETLEDFRARGREEASLGGVALASTSERERPLERGLGWVFEHGGRIYDAKGLLAFKQKFAPAWAPQYLLYPTAFDLPRIVVAVARAFRERTPDPAEGRELEDVPATAEDEAAAAPSAT